jgi:hypothetical protein
MAQCPLSVVKRTWAIAPHMSAYDPKRTFPSPLNIDIIVRVFGKEQRRLQLAFTLIFERDLHFRAICFNFSVFNRR